MTSLGTVFTNQMAGLCAKNPDVIYFAGRGRDLPKFLAPLAKTHCAEKPLTVLTGDDASQVLQVNGADVLGEIHALPARTSRGPAAGSPY